MLQEVDKVFVRSDGTLVVSVKGTEPPRYVEVKPFSNLDPSAFRYGASQVPSGALVATVAHGLGATPSLVLLSAATGSVGLSIGATDATYIRAQTTVTVAAPIVFTWVAGR